MSKEIGKDLQLFIRISQKVDVHSSINSTLFLLGTYPLPSSWRAFAGIATCFKTSSYQAHHLSLFAYIEAIQKRPIFYVYLHCSILQPLLFA